MKLLPLFSGDLAVTDRRILVDDTVSGLLAAGAPVAIGVSGGKDSSALAFETVRHLDAVGHRGPRVLVHADLGRVEWRESLPVCERLAGRLGLELIVVRRQAGDMMDRWLVRWRNNVRRYEDLSCVKLILPWSTPAMRFCTSELKTAPICAALIKRFPGRTILSASGIRRQESTKRAKAPISKAQPKLTSKKWKTAGVDWHPILDHTLGDVLAVHAKAGFPLHEAYVKYGTSRVSCGFCIMGSAPDLVASAACPDNEDVYLEMVDLEIASTFAFQNSWLGDVAPHLLGDERRVALHEAKVRALRREAAERRIPDHLLYVKGWPTCVPTLDEARLLAEVRREVSAAVRLEARCLDAASIVARYEELMALKRDGAEVDDD